MQVGESTPKDSEVKRPSEISKHQFLEGGDVCNRTNRRYSRNKKRPCLKLSSQFSVAAAKSKLATDAKNFGPKDLAQVCHTRARH